MADGSSDDWLPAGWTISVRMRRSGKKDKLYFAPCGLKFYSKVEVMRHLNTVKSSSPQLEKENDAIITESAEDALQKGSPNIEEKGKLGLLLSSLHIRSRTQCQLSIFFISQWSDWMWCCTCCRALLNLRISITLQGQLLMTIVWALHRATL
ncbi:hypothetical protein SAY86_022983 [Trapa natans]|uniref:MBD domain-containing protein n=1 Tax=Trapa natans TaxID=22666 RepID=A0AAN7M6J8_TRANT|nr:hypothetical protein SAY86_022983 [Trapa natans]